MMFSPNAIFLANHSNMNYLTKKTIFFNLHFLKKSGSIFFTFTLLEKERKLHFSLFTFRTSRTILIAITISCTKDNIWDLDELFHKLTKIKNIN